MRAMKQEKDTRPTPGRAGPSRGRWSSTSPPRTLREQTATIGEKEKRASTITRWTGGVRTFVEACGYVAGRCAEEDPENHGARHQSSAVGRAEEAQAGQD